MSSDSSDDDETKLRLLIQARNYLNEVLIPREEAKSSNRSRTRRYIYRDRVGAHQTLMNNYFGEISKYPKEYFKHRFPMRERLFFRIFEGITTYSIDPISEYFLYFLQRHNARGVPGLSTIQKVTSALCQLAYGTTPDAFDEHLQMSERTSHETLRNFTRCIINLYANVDMREPTKEDIRQLFAKHKEIRVFPGILGSIDCMHWAWTQCSNAWKGQCTRDDHEYLTIMLEVVASYDMWFGHAYFGVARSNNDLNVFNSSPLLNKLLNDSAPEISYQVCEVDYGRGHYHADRIYPSWAAFVKDSQVLLMQR